MLDTVLQRPPLQSLPIDEEGAMNPVINNVQQDAGQLASIGLANLSQLSSPVSTSHEERFLPLNEIYFSKYLLTAGNIRVILYKEMLGQLNFPVQKKETQCLSTAQPFVHFHECANGRAVPRYAKILAMPKFLLHH